MCQNARVASPEINSAFHTEIELAVAATSAAPRSLSYNPAENAVLLGSDADNGSYELYVVPRDSKGEASPVRLLNLNLALLHTSCHLKGKLSVSIYMYELWLTALCNMVPPPPEGLDWTVLMLCLHFAISMPATAQSLTDLLSSRGIVQDVFHVRTPCLCDAYAMMRSCDKRSHETCACLADKMQYLPEEIV